MSMKIAAGSLVMLLYDHCLTLSDEYRYAWKAPPSFAKYALLTNRYFVLAVSNFGSVFARILTRAHFPNYRCWLL
jgi:hypothetical protein